MTRDDVRIVTDGFDPPRRYFVQRWYRPPRANGYMPPHWHDCYTRRSRKAAERVAARLERRLDRSDARCDRRPL